MRGKPSRLHCCTTHTRITPADAGKTQKTHLLNHTYQDHPRACGENQNIFYLPSGTEGSPPRMRGKLRVRFWAVIQYRITPAHAGKTISASTSAQVCAGSPPRMRGKLFPFGLCYRFVRITPAHAGKTLQIHTTYYHMTGSPPRMRGKPAKYFILPTNSGITPAHAGKTTKPPTKKLTERDHPRACGENLFAGR